MAKMNAVDIVSINESHMNFLTLLSFLFSLVIVNTFSIDYPQYYGNLGAIRQLDDGLSAKRVLPMKIRRSPLDGFEDLSSVMRSIDGIQKPRRPNFLWFQRTISGLEENECRQIEGTWQIFSR
ncbi:hypothetical protein DICVIV_07274 [Dictyocaulus viviparus]|uniref:Uncharacterized protein n=1 Tax=Dictyocaulus viviparus TaxID=29172 RepID=A0A0D8XWD1_DICVI|nr:hypothetical protein DICVIV_07274 [Dictyocaulus viviparus]